MRSLLSSIALSSLTLALLACSDARLAPLQGAWAVDQAALAADPRLRTLTPTQRAKAIELTLAQSNPRLLFKDDTLTITDGDQVRQGRISVDHAEGSTLTLSSTAGPTSLTLNTTTNRLIVQVGAISLTLQRVDSPPSEALKGEPAQPATEPTTAPQQQGDR